jgi:hypothetical protein
MISPVWNSSSLGVAFCPERAGCLYSPASRSLPRLFMAAYAKLCHNRNSSKAHLMRNQIAFSQQIMRGAHHQGGPSCNGTYSGAGETVPSEESLCRSLRLAAGTRGVPTGLQPAVLVLCRRDSRQGLLRHDPHRLVGGGAGAPWLQTVPAIFDTCVVWAEVTRLHMLGPMTHARSHVAQLALATHVPCFSFVTNYPILQAAEDKPFGSR